MPTVRSIVAGLCLTTCTFLSTTSAAAITAKVECVKVLSLPLTGAAIELPTPTLELAYVLVGRGVQNYTCASAGASPVAIGAVANLYDATSIARLSTAFLHAIVPNAVYLSTPKKGAAFLGVPYLGHHFFDSAGTPVFSLDAQKGTKSIAYVKKSANVVAPANAEKGPAKTGAVDWLFLEAKTDAGYAGKSVNVKQVYRVVTSGGVGGSCAVAGVKSVEYAAEYWLYK